MANCIKCGKELSATKVFCEECLEVMERYPVPSGTPIFLNPRGAAVKKAPGKKKLSPEEQVLKLKRRIKQLTTALVIVTILLGITLGHLIWKNGNPKTMAEETKGQNYSTQPGTTTPPVQTTTAPDTTP